MRRERAKRGGNPTGMLSEEWAHLSSIAALDRLMRYVRDEASSLNQWVAADLIETAINSLPNSPSLTPGRASKLEKPRRSSAVGD
jgi:hypothetical protein